MTNGLPVASPAPLASISGFESLAESPETEEAHTTIARKWERGRPTARSTIQIHPPSPGVVWGEEPIILVAWDALDAPNQRADKASEMTMTRRQQQAFAWHVLLLFWLACVDSLGVTEAVSTKRLLPVQSSSQEQSCDGKCRDSIRLGRSRSCGGDP